MFPSESYFRQESLTCVAWLAPEPCTLETGFLFLDLIILHRYYTPEDARMLDIGITFVSHKPDRFMRFLTHS
jgi:hypothetical protein